MKLIIIKCFWLSESGESCHINCEETKDKILFMILRNFEVNMVVCDN